MTIDEICEYAKDNGFDSLEFEFINLKGEKVKCKWLDAYFGMFEIEGSEGFITVKQWKQFATNTFDYTPLN